MSDETAESPVVPPVSDVGPVSPPPAGLGRAKRGVVTLAVVVGLVVGAGSVGAAWALSGSSSGDGADGSFALTGNFKLTGDNVPSGDTNENCQGYGGYDDIAEGSSVTVYNAAGQVVATGALGTGTPSGTACVFPVSVPDVPDGSKFYGVEISHRGKIQVSADEAKTGLFGASLG